MCKELKTNVLRLSATNANGPSVRRRGSTGRFGGSEKPVLREDCQHRC